MANPHRTTGWTTAALAALFLTPAAPAFGSSGGASVPGGAAPPASATTGLMPAGGSLAAMPPKPETLQAPPAGALLGRITMVHGQLTDRDANRPVLLEFFDARRGWQVVAKARTNSVGGFTFALRPKHIGRFLFRVTTPQAATAATSARTPSTQIEVYRPVVATIFGPGSYGAKTACGETLTPASLGVAHLTLPCGTPVDITYGSHTITVPVVDRGPYTAHVSYDLTTATAIALGINETANIGALAIHTRH